LDLATEKQLAKFDHVHTDYVRALTPGSATNPHLLLSGSYDRTMKLIDRRISNNDNILMNFDHGDQIESVRMKKNRQNPEIKCLMKYFDYYSQLNFLIGINVCQ
jgi:hypothetical protein